MLWVATAKAALAAGYRVSVSVTGSRPRSDEIRSLATAGAALQYRRYLRNQSIQRRLDAVLFPFGPLLRFNPDVLCLTQAAMFDYAEAYTAHAIRKLTRGWTIPYVLNCQYADDAYSLNSTRRERARELFRRAAVVGVFSIQNLEAYQRQLALPLNNARLLHNTPNMTDWSPLPWPIEDEPLGFAFVGRLASVKGLDIALQVLGRPAWRGRKWLFNVYGCGPEEAHLRNLVEMYELADKVRFHGPTDNVRAVWADHHLGVLTSRAEGMSLALTETLLCGRPVVVTDVGSAREWVTDGHTGFLADGVTVAAVGAAFERAWAAQDSWPAIGRRAHDRVATAIPSDPARELLQILESVGRVDATPRGTNLSHP